MKKSLFAPIVLGALALAVGGCATPPAASSSAAPSVGASTPVAQSDFKACMVSDAGGFDDKSFNETAHNGLKRAVAELGVQQAEVQSAKAADYAKNVQAMVDAKCDVIVTVGFALGDATAAAAKKNPDIEFAIVDFAYSDDKGNNIAEKNVKGLVFNTAEPSFLAGYAGVRPLPRVSPDVFEGMVAGRNLLLVDDLIEQPNAELRAMIPGYVANSVRRLRGWLETGRYRRDVPGVLA